MISRTSGWASSESMHAAMEDSSSRAGIIAEILSRAARARVASVAANGAADAPLSSGVVSLAAASPIFSVLMFREKRPATLQIDWLGDGRQFNSPNRLRIR